MGQALLGWWKSSITKVSWVALSTHRHGERHNPFTIDHLSINSPKLFQFIFHFMTPAITEIHLIDIILNEHSGEVSKNWCIS